MLWMAVLLAGAGVAQPGTDAATDAAIAAARAEMAKLAKEEAEETDKADYAWIRCLSERVVEHILTPEPAGTVVDAAFWKCRTHEETALKAMINEKMYGSLTGPHRLQTQEEFIRTVTDATDKSMAEKKERIKGSLSAYILEFRSNPSQAVKDASLGKAQ